MGKKKISKKKNNISELRESRDGGQNALRGYSYQMLYSSYLILTSEENIIFKLEGVEDVDIIKYCENDERNIHVQLKYSTSKQDASFMDDVLKNFLETYLIDINRTFKLVYDFTLANGNLSKLILGELDIDSKIFWENKIDQIRKKCLSWNWENYNFDDFISKLSFECIKKESLESKIGDLLINKFGIETDNIILFANAIKLLCLDIMEQRGEITLKKIVGCIENVKFNISKGIINPAHYWIKRIDFLGSDNYSSDYYEGKKATPSDIANNLPIERPFIEKEILNSIDNNFVTIIKTSSGQGKTTLALRTLFLLKDKYAPYQLILCNDLSEIKYIIDYFYMCTRMGEVPIILLDNLDGNLKEWNKLIQFMQSNVKYHFKVVITTREDDWYNYGGDISNIRALKFVKPSLTETEAKSIFFSLRNAGKLHSSIDDWRKSWLKIADRKLLIEYVYLLTHGKMIDERISEQLKVIGNSTAGGLKFEILRNVCFADVCGIKLETKALIKNLNIKTDLDIGEILKSLSDEFFVHVSVDGDYIEGLHPVRSNHIVNHLHEYFPLEETAVSITKIVTLADISILFSYFTEYEFNKETFYSKIVELWIGDSSLSKFVSAIRGTFSGSVMQYFKKNKILFDDAYKHGGHELLFMELCPFVKFNDLEEEIVPLNNLEKLFPKNENINYLLKLRDSIPKFNISKTDIYYFCYALYLKLKDIDFNSIFDLDSYVTIVDWLYNIDVSFNLTTNISLDDFWENIKNCSYNSVASLMYSFYCGNKDSYNKFIKKNLLNVINYFKYKTNSHIIKFSSDYKEIKVEYILRTNDNGNEESVKRLKTICRALPIFEMYCSDSIVPRIDMLVPYKSFDEAHKEMPKRNLVITFHQEFSNLWLKTLESNYEYDTIYDWVMFWLEVRQYTCNLLDECCKYIYKLLSKRKTDFVALNSLFKKFSNMINIHLYYPRESRPFEKSLDIAKEFNEVKKNYFNAISNFVLHFYNFLLFNESSQRLVIYNLKLAFTSIENLHDFFDNFGLDDECYDIHKKLCSIETNIIWETYLCCEYYLSHNPVIGFNKCIIKDWYGSIIDEKIKKINLGLFQLNNLFDVCFPYKIYFDNVFLCYPIILKNFDAANELMMGSFLSIVATVQNDFLFDYLILLTVNDNDEINRNAIKFSKKTFQIINKGDENELDFLSVPYPIEVTQKMLDCFEEEFFINKHYINNTCCNEIFDIGENLWIYSKNCEILTDDIDMDYLSSNLRDIKNIISEKLKNIYLKVPKDTFNLIKKICNDVYYGEIFDDKKLNELISLFNEI